jgi:aspartyl-tRNA(Asn)/glutamyl-tRNA(Gln) amidotransferase subunit B
VQWQIDTIENGGSIHQATILFNPDTGETRAMRSKEDAHDYRYFPDPDLLPLEISSEWIEQVRGTLPELPEAKRIRYTDELGLNTDDAVLLTTSIEIASYFDDALKFLVQDGQPWIARDAASAKEFWKKNHSDVKLVTNWLMGEVNAQLNRDGLEMSQCPVNALQLSGILKRIKDSTISNSGAKELFRNMWAQGRIIYGTDLAVQLAGETTTTSAGSVFARVDQLIEDLGLRQVSDSGAIEALVDEIIAGNADKVAEYRAGRDKLFGFFVGLAMKASKGKANPVQLNDILKKKLAG